MYGCESWTIKKAECWRISASELWCWRRIPWRARRSNQSILKETNTIQWKDLMLKLQYFGHMMQRADSLKKTLTLGKIEGKRKRGQQRTRWLESITNSMDMNLSKLWETVKDSRNWWATQSMGSQGVGHELVSEQQVLTRNLAKFKYQKICRPS